MNIDKWSLATSFLGGFSGGVIAPALIESWKDSLSGMRSYKTQKRQTIEALRFTLAQIEAFWVLKDASVGKMARAFPERVNDYADALANFDLSLLTATVPKFGMIGTSFKATAAPAQFMMKELTTIISLMRVFQKSITHSPQELIKELDSRKDDLFVFIGSIYAEFLNIDGQSLTFDRQIFDFEMKLREIRLNQAQEDLSTARAQYERNKYAAT